MRKLSENRKPFLRYLFFQRSDAYNEKPQGGDIRSIDVAEYLGVTKPSVTYTTKRLRENGYITMDADRLITLTDSGMDIVSKMPDRHHTLTKFLVTPGIDEITAEKDACKIEHDISQETYEAICAHAREMSRD